MCILKMKMKTMKTTSTGPIGVDGGEDEHHAGW
jgi:hypothetical protein